MHKITVNALLESKYFSDAGLYAYYNMGGHYIYHDFTPRFRSVLNNDNYSAYSC